MAGGLCGAQSSTAPPSAADGDGRDEALETATAMASIMTSVVLAAAAQAGGW
ncbi:hypothetical protein [Methylobacterium sp. Leaf88]|uniref:hypothetical protein n=1 Tax=Methylobacterium sp. Leaf88 TaxID=1736244 RepID=UPI000A6D8715|nr:hypothetical protein [Methylobacterium sp. Leaf88]